MKQMRELRNEELSEVSGGLLAELAIGVACLVVAEFALGYSIGKDLAANDAK